MNYIQLGNSDINASQIALGCMRMADLDLSHIERVVGTSFEEGINFFDHADIYGKGESEVKFGQALNNLSFSRQDVYLQGKCGIREGFYDLSKDHILKSVEEILTRLNTDYLDLLSLHRPDALMEPSEIAEAFYQLKKEGKVRYFGVSNFGPTHTQLLQQSLPDHLVANQLQFGLKHTGLIAENMNVNMMNEIGISRNNNVLDYMRLNNMTLQAWSPYQYGYFEGIFIDSPKFKTLNNEMENIANQYKVSKEAIGTAWISRHPANIQTIIGTMTPERIRGIARSTQITLTREEWYRLYVAAGHVIL